MLNFFFFSFKSVYHTTQKKNDKIRNINCSYVILGGFLCAYYVVHEQQNVGSFVLYTSYVIQVYGPLSDLGLNYRQIQQTFIDLENLLDLFRVEVEVKDTKGAMALNISNGGGVGGGEIVFDRVCFHYRPDRPLLKDISFKASPLFFYQTWDHAKNHPVIQFRREIVHLTENNFFQPIRFEYSTCMPYGLSLPFSFRGEIGWECGL